MRSRRARLARTVASEAFGLVQRWRGPQRGRARILYYHRIDDEQHRSCVSVKAFAEQMKLLSDAGYHLLPYAEILHHLQTQQPFPDRSIVVTFDDGFADNYHHAFPILQKHGIPASIFLTVGFIGTDRLPVLRDHPGAPPLSWSQVEELARSGIEIGSHTMSHASLPTLGDTELAEELRRPKQILEDRLQREITSFCYPRGHFDDRTIDAVRTAGYLLACTTMPGCVSPASQFFSLRRTFIARDDTLRDFELKLEGAFDSLHEALQWWRSARNSKGPGKITDQSGARTNRDNP